MHQQGIFITPDEQSQEFMSQLSQFDSNENALTLNPDIFQQMAKDQKYYHLEKVLYGQPPTDQETQRLSDNEKLQMELLQKKKHSHPNKRVEEKQKFVFKKVFKRIENNFNNRSRKAISKQKQQKNSLEFYEHYFKETAKLLQKPLWVFLHPQKKLKIGIQEFHSGFKSFNQSYIKLIMQSSSFKNEAKKYLQFYFVQECLKELQQKLYKFVNFWQKKYEETMIEYEQLHVKNDDEEYFRNFVRLKMEKFVLENAKCKVPWSYQEILDVQKFAFSMIDNDMEIEDDGLQQSQL